MIISLAVTLMLAGNGPCRVASWQRLVAREAARHPAMQLPDLYKLVLQATMGSEHAAGDTAMATDWMHRELATLGPPLSGEELLDTLGHDGRYVRVNLRPFVARGGDVVKLLDAFLATPKVEPPDTAAFRCAADAADDLARARAVPWNADSLHAYLAREVAAGYPAVDHSAAYTTAYRPAYRVIARSLVRDVVPRR